MTSPASVSPVSPRSATARPATARPAPARQQTARPDPATSDSSPSPSPAPRPRPALRVIHSPSVLKAAPRGWQQALPLDWELPNGIPADPPAPRHLRVVGAPPLGQPGHAPHPGPWVARLAPAIFEVIAGERPVTQLTRWVTREILTTLARRHTAARRHPAGRARAPERRTARSVRIHAVAPGIIEASAVVSTSQRSRAIALRLETIGRDTASGPRWLVTACEIG